jgi:ubiquinone/menaquinone biosynthesis C-methylase UbiE
VTTDYVIRGGQAGRDRLRVIAHVLWPTTERLLAAAGIAPGMRCLDVGCGGGDVSFAMARLVGPLGAVTSIDRDEAKLQLARDDAAREGLRNVDFRQMNVDDLADEAAYDLVYARFLLSHLLDPGAALRRMVRAAKPGGAIVVEDIDHSGVFGYPPSPAIARYVQFYNEVVRRRGADPEIGPRLPGLFREAGLPDPRVTLAQPVLTKGDGKRVNQITLDNIRSAVVAEGLATDAEITALIAELDRFTEDPDTLVGFPRVYQVWATRQQ